jgi:peptidoglycan hydrolase CwlO-like protein
MNGESLLLLGFREFCIVIAIQFALVLVVAFAFWRLTHMTLSERIVGLLQKQSDALDAATTAQAAAEKKASDLQTQIDAANAKLDELGAPK